MKRKGNNVDPIESLIGGRKIALLLAVADAGSYSGAAASLGISQPGVSQQVANLEGLVGLKFFRRIRHGVQLTQGGKAVIVYARAMHKLTADLRRELANNTRSLKVGIGMSEDLCRTALPAVLALFIVKHPTVDLHILSGTYDNISAGIDSGTIDFAAMRRCDRFPEAELLWSDELVWLGKHDWVCPPSGPIPLVLPLAPNPARDPPIQALRAAGREWRVRFESSGLAGVEAAMEAGLGVCAGPRHMQFYGSVSQLSPKCGLPALPSAEFVIAGLAADASPAVHAMAEIFRQAGSVNFDAK